MRLGFGFAPHRIAFVTDAMAATDCPDGHYLLGALDVNVIDGHARLASNGAIAGFTLTLEKAVQRAVLELGFTPTDAVEAATLDSGQSIRFRSCEPGHQAAARSACPRLCCRRASAQPRHLGRRTRLVRRPLSSLRAIAET